MIEDKRRPVARKEKEEMRLSRSRQQPLKYRLQTTTAEIACQEYERMVGRSISISLVFFDVFLYHIFFALQCLTSTTRINDNAPVTIWAFFVQSGFYCWWVHFWLYDAVKLDLSLKLYFQWDLEAHTKTLLWIRRRTKEMLWSLNGLFPLDCYPHATPL